MDKVQEAFTKGEAWYDAHRDHIKKMLIDDDNPYDPVPASVQPTGSDLLRPELWKPMHWRWFLQNRP